MILGEQPNTYIRTLQDTAAHCNPLQPTAATHCKNAMVTKTLSTSLSHVQTLAFTAAHARCAHRTTHLSTHQLAFTATDVQYAVARQNQIFFLFLILYKRNLESHTHTRTHANTYMHVRTNTQTHTHSHTHTYTHTASLQLP